jgi:ribosomal protein S18 acetylase RimI-like enzyme
MLRGWDEGYEVPSLGIAVLASARGTGLGRTFMQFLHSAARLQGAPRVRLKVYPENAAAWRLYESLGYCFEPGADHQLLGIYEFGKWAA